MNGIKNSNLGLAFLLEFAGLLILGYYGFSLHLAKSLQLVAGILLPLSVALLWGNYCAPASSYRLDGWALIGLKCLIFGGITFALMALDKPMAALIFALLVIINLVISIYFGTL